MYAHTSFKDLPAWQRSMRLVAEIYQLTAQLPAAERLGLSSSLQVAAVRVPSLLASGTKSGRSGFQDACIDARGSCAEMETLLLIVQQLYPTLPVDDLLAEVADTQDLLTDMVRRLATKAAQKIV